MPVIVIYLENRYGGIYEFDSFYSGILFMLMYFGLSVDVFYCWLFLGQTGSMLEHARSCS